MEKENGDDLGVCVLNLKIIKRKSNSRDHANKRSREFKGGSFLQ